MTHDGMVFSVVISSDWQQPCLFSSNVKALLKRNEDNIFTILNAEKALGPRSLARDFIAHSTLQKIKGLLATTIMPCFTRNLIFKKVAFTFRCN